MIRVLGLDPGSRITGYGVIEIIDKNVSYIACGVVRMNSQTLADRLQTIYAGITEVIKSYQPSEMAIEQVFMHQNVRSALMLGHARAAGLLAGANHGLKVYEYAARQVKKAVVGSGRADKKQVQYLIRCLLNLSKEPQADAADALACALCHHHFRGQRWIKNDHMALKGGRIQ